MDEKKVPVGSTPHLEETTVGSCQGRKQLLLYAYAVAITVLLVSTVVYGSVLYSQTRYLCDQEIERSTAEKDTIAEYLYKGYGASNGAVVVLDFKKRMTSMYVRSESSCYITSFRSKKDPATEDNNGQLRFEVASERPMSIRSLFPRDIQELCQGLPIYWLETSSARGYNEAGSRGEVIDDGL